MKKSILSLVITSQLVVLISANGFGSSRCRATRTGTQGGCISQSSRYYYDSASNSCLEFQGCNGLGNNFRTLRQCQSTCTTAPTTANQQQTQQQASQQNQYNQNEATGTGPCTINPCAFNERCESIGSKGYRCVYNAEISTTAPNSCEGKPCNFGETCVADGVYYKCERKAPTDSTPCTPNPCAANQRCVNKLRGRYECHDKKRKNPCIPNPCQTRERCTRNGDTYSCKRFGNPCFPNPCANNQRCHRNGSEYQCKDKIDLSPCKPNPCDKKTQRCKNLGNGTYQCVKKPSNPCFPNPCDRKTERCKNLGNGAHQCDRKRTNPCFPNPCDWKTERCKNLGNGTHQCEQKQTTIKNPCIPNPCNTNERCIRIHNTANFRCELKHSRQDSQGYTDEQLWTRRNQGVTQKNAYAATTANPFRPPQCIPQCASGQRCVSRGGQSQCEVYRAARKIKDSDRTNPCSPNPCSMNRFNKICHQTESTYICLRLGQKVSSDTGPINARQRSAARKTSLARIFRNRNVCSPNPCRLNEHCHVQGNSHVCRSQPMIKICKWNKCRSDQICIQDSRGIQRCLSSTSISHLVQKTASNVDSGVQTGRQSLRNVGNTGQQSVRQTGERGRQALRRSGSAGRQHLRNTANTGQTTLRGTGQKTGTSANQVGSEITSETDMERIRQAFQFGSG